MSEHHGSDIKFMFGFFLGGILGALTIFFLGTKEGKKAGKVLEEKGKGILDDISDRVAEYEKKGKELVEEGKKIEEEVIDKVEEKIEEKKEVLTEAATEKLDTALAKIEEIQAQGQKTTAELRTHIFKNTPKKR